MTLLDVYSAIDPEMFLIECMDPEFHCIRDGQDDLPCRVHYELADIQQEMYKMLKRKPLSVLVGKE